MKKSFIIHFVVIVILLLTITSCKNSGIDSDASASQAKAYFEVFQNLYNEDTGLNGGKYIYVDLTKIKLNDKTAFIALMNNFCKENNLILLQKTFDELKAEGLVVDLYLKDGILISFEDTKLTNNTLRTSAKKWRSGDGAIGADFTVEFKNGSWYITKTDNSWIS